MIIQCFHLQEAHNILVETLKSGENNQLYDTDCSSMTTQTTVGLGWVLWKCSWSWLSSSYRSVC